MIIKLYNTSSPNNTINKVLQDEREFNITFKDTADIINPTVKLYSKSLLLYNYAYIPDFGRYYFINNITTVPKDIYILDLKCDVLESFKDDILQATGLITRNANGNPYFDGGDYLTEVRKTHTIYESDIELDFNTSIIVPMFKIKKE